MKSLVLQTDAPRSFELSWKRVFWTTVGPRGIEVQSTLVLVAPSRTLADMLVETDDGASEFDVREAIQAAALADDWKLANEIVTRYGISACLRCAADVSNRPTWRLHRLVRERKDCWGEICGSCAIVMKELGK